MHQRNWSEQDLDLLRTVFHNETKSRLLEIFPNRTWNAIKLKGERMLLRRPPAGLPRDIKEKCCKLCKLSFKPVVISQRYCPRCVPKKSEDPLAYDRFLYQLHREKCIARAKSYIKTPKGRGSHRSIQRRRYEKWGYISDLPDILPCDIEVHGLSVMKSIGFTNIVNLTELYTMFPFDAYAEFNSKRTVIDITCSPYKSKLSTKFRLANTLGLDFYILFIKPDKSHHYLAKIDRERISISVPISEYEAVEAIK